MLLTNHVSSLYRYYINCVITILEYILSAVLNRQHTGVSLLSHFFLHFFVHYLFIWDKVLLWCSGWPHTIFRLHYPKCYHTWLLHLPLVTFCVLLDSISCFLVHHGLWTNVEPMWRVLIIYHYTYLWTVNWHWVWGMKRIIFFFTWQNCFMVFQGSRNKNVAWEEELLMMEMTPSGVQCCRVGTNSELSHKFWHIVPFQLSTNFTFHITVLSHQKLSELLTILISIIYTSLYIVIILAI